MPHLLSEEDELEELMTGIQGGEDEEGSTCWDDGSGSGFGP